MIPYYLFCDTPKQLIHNNIIGMEWLSGLRFKTSAVGGIFLRANHGVRKEVPPSPTQALQIPTGASYAKHSYTIPHIGYTSATHK